MRRIVTGLLAATVMLAFCDTSDAGLIFRRRCRTCCYTCNSVYSACNYDQGGQGQYQPYPQGAPAPNDTYAPPQGAPERPAAPTPQA